MVAKDNLDEYAAEVPEELQSRFHQITAVMDRFCDKQLDAEFRDVCRRILACYCQPSTNIDRGKPESWAAGVVYEAGQVNFLSDPSFKPHCKSEEIAKGCGVSVATMQSKGRDIRESLQLMQFDPMFTVPSRLQDNPLAWLMELPNGMIVSLKDLPDEFRQKLGAAGMLPDDADQPAVGDWRERKLASPRQAQAGLVYTLKITLKGSEPPIWRRVQLPDCTLEDLHEVIQVAMGWDNAHLHEFEIKGRRFGPSSGGFGVDSMWAMDRDDQEPSEETLLSDVAPSEAKKKFRFSYMYDFGDSWDHEIVVERMEHMDKPPTHPVCLDGKRACPPEDCGGVWGYENLLEVVSDRKHPEYAEMRDWLGRFDPEAFNLKAVNKAFRSWRRMA